MMCSIQSCLNTSKLGKLLHIPKWDKMVKLSKMNIWLFKATLSIEIDLDKCCNDYKSIVLG